MLPEIWGSFLNEISQLSSIFKGASETFIRRLSGVSLIKRVNHTVADSLSEKKKKIEKSVRRCRTKLPASHWELHPRAESFSRSRYAE